MKTLLLKSPGNEGFKSFYRIAFAFLIVLLMSFQQVSAQFKVIGYVPSWGGNLNDVQYSKLTHINYAFLIPTTNGGYQAPDANRLKTLVSLAHAQNVKVIISVGGGGGGDAFRSICPNASLRTTFVNNMMNFVNQYNLDGVDIDWEFPSTGTEANNFSLLMQELYAKMHSSGKLCTIAVIAYGGTSIINSVFNAIDFLNIMAYDENSYDHSTYDLGVKSVNYWVGRGLPANKAVLGVPFYGRDRCCDYKTVGYNDILNMGGSPNADTYNNQIGYNGIPTMKKKTAYAIQSCGGIMIWSLDTDVLGANSLLSAINEVVVANSNPVPDNLAKGKTVTVSSTEANSTISTTGSNATDGSYSTRWSSLFADPQWLSVDLGATYAVNRVKITWEAAYAKDYQIQISSNGTDWSVLKSVTGNSVTINDQNALSGTGRYVRIYGTARATAYGYSIMELEVYGSPIETPFSGTAISLPGKIEVENYDLGGQGLAYNDADASNQGGAYRTNEGVDVQTTTDVDGGYNIGYTSAGEWMKYMVNVTASGAYNIGFRTAATSATGAIRMEVDGLDVTGTVTLPNTGGWQTWATTTVSNVSLAAGAHIVRLYVVNAGFNLNYVEVKPVLPNQLPSVTIVSPVSGYSTTAPANISITANASDSDGSVSKVDFYNGSTLLGTSTSTPYNYTWSNVAPGTYSITAQVTDDKGAVTTSSAVSVSVNSQSTCNPVIWSDEFNGTSLDQTKWSYQTGDGCPGNCGWGNNELEYYTNSTNNVSVSGGSLSLTALYQPNYNGTGKNYTSGKLVSAGKYSHLYGKFEARIKIPSAQGIWPAFWLLPDGGGWPQNGEIDILETVNKNSNWYGTLHYGNSSGSHLSSGTSWAPSSDLSGDYHVYAADWTKDQITFYVDGVNRGTVTKSAVQASGGVWPFDSHNFYIILNVAVGGNWPGAPNSSQYPVSMLVDYVRVYDNSPCTVTEAPYGGVARNIPGKIEAEDYDIGGQGLAYNDADASNLGGAYRTDGVDIQSTTDAGGGYNLGYTSTGEWLKYMVNVTASGTYSIGFRTASTSATGSLRMEVDGQDVTGTVALPNTGAWQTWATTKVSNVALSAGAHTIRIFIVNAGFNLNYVEVTSELPNQAPSASIVSPVNGDTLIAPASIVINANASDADGSISKVDFYNGTTLLGSDATAPYTYTWSNVAIGNYIISVKATDNAGAAVQSESITLVVKKPPINQLPIVSITTPVNNASYDAPASIAINVSASDVDGAVSKVEFYNGATLLGTDVTAPYSVTWTNVAAGTYSLTAKVTDDFGASVTSSVVSVKVNTVVVTNPCSNIPQYKENNGYVAGSKVQMNGKQYQCKPYPYSGWCNGAAWAYAPGTGTYWGDAWTLIGSCSAKQASEESTNSANINSYPNPFNNLTSVDVVVEDAGDVEVKVYDKTGKVVATLVEGYLSTGTHTFSFDASNLSPDLYLIKYNVGSKVFTRKVVKTE